MIKKTRGSKIFDLFEIEKDYKKNEFFKSNYDSDNYKDNNEKNVSILSKKSNENKNNNEILNNNNFIDTNEIFIIKNDDYIPTERLESEDFSLRIFSDNKKKISNENFDNIKTYQENEENIKINNISNNNNSNNNINTNLEINDIKILEKKENFILKEKDLSVFQRIKTNFINERRNNKIDLDNFITQDFKYLSNKALSEQVFEDEEISSSENSNEISISQIKDDNKNQNKNKNNSREIEMEMAINLDLINEKRNESSNSKSILKNRSNNASNLLITNNKIVETYQ